MSGITGGDAWKRDHKKILDHAKGLKYDKVPGVTLPSPDAPKAEWIAAMNKFNAWKAGEVKKEASGQAWWQTYGRSSGGGGDGGGGGNKGGGNKPGPDWDNPSPPSGTGPYPLPNIYFPMLVPEYTAPQAQNWSQYMPSMPGADSIWGGGVDLGINNGLLYQPWTQTYGDMFVQDNLWNYAPPQLNVGRPQYLQPIKLSMPSGGEEGGGSGGGGKKKGDDNSQYPEGDQHLPRPDGGRPDGKGDYGDRPGHDPSIGNPSGTVFT